MRNGYSLHTIGLNVWPKNALMTSIRKGKSRHFIAIAEHLLMFVLWLLTRSYVCIPAKTDDGFLSTNAAFESCQQFARKPSASLDSCSPDDFDTNSTVPCQDYVWDTSQWTESLTTVNNLVCEQDSVRRLSGTAVIAGLFIGKYSLQAVEVIRIYICSSRIPFAELFLCFHARFMLQVL